PDMIVFQSELHRLPEVPEILRNHRHRKRHGYAELAGPIHRTLLQVPETGTAELLFGLLSGTVVLQVKLEMPVADPFAQLAGEGLVPRQPDAVRIHEDVVDFRMILTPSDQGEKFGMQGGFAPGELQDLDFPLPIDDTLDARLQLL